MTFKQAATLLFQSTPPARGATGYVALMEIGSIIISIHAPREGGDKKQDHVKYLSSNFNPRPPRGGRH